MRSDERKEEASSRSKVPVGPRRFWCHIIRRYAVHRLKAINRPTIARRTVGELQVVSSICTARNNFDREKKRLVGRPEEECRKYICLADRVDSSVKQEAGNREGLLEGTSHIRNILLFLHARQPKPMPRNHFTTQTYTAPNSFPSFVLLFQVPSLCVS